MTVKMLVAVLVEKECGGHFLSFLLCSPFLQASRTACATEAAARPFAVREMTEFGARGTRTVFTNSLKAGAEKSTE
ncbi:hypothetical protein ADL12_34125 [Streptomyces regalis]|uniref:Uncharacterized protein n=1 Tax=Streptomyces regalis TaxID=68262 RepID=A0A101JFA9_9ACTN|nr:hypothetical protein ADL12_34125 [Streptomyces regalis]